MRDVLDNSLNHLIRTQRQLEMLVLGGETDIEYRNAIADNKPVIERFFRQLKEIQRLIITVRAHQGHGSQNVLFVPEEEWTAADEVAARLNAIQIDDADHAFGKTAREEEQREEDARLAADGKARADALAEEEAVAKALASTLAGAEPIKMPLSAKEKAEAMTAKFRETLQSMESREKGDDDSAAEGRMGGAAKSRSGDQELDSRGGLTL